MWAVCRNILGSEMKTCKHVFADGESALMLVCVRLRYVATKEWGTKRYLNMKHLYEQEKENELRRELERIGKNEIAA